MCKIIVTYRKRESGDPCGMKVFVGKNQDEALVLAANYQSAHPEIIDDTFKIS